MSYYAVTNYYFATGEGASDFLLICSAASPEKAREKFVKEFGEYMATGCEVKELTPESLDDESRYLSPHMATVIKNIVKERGYLQFAQQFHFNLS